MTIGVGDAFPSVLLKRVDARGVEDVDVAAWLAGKRVVWFAVPGAFTPTCSAQHLPGYLEHAPAILARGVDAIACVSVNDAFVMAAWAKAQNVGATVAMFADGNGALATALGLSFDGSAFGLGVRSQRYAAIVQSGVVEALFVERPGEFRVSSAEAILAALG